jgi:Replication initiator protein A (RepA) N-terminus.
MITHSQVENPGPHQMMLDYFYGQSGELFAYFRIPKALFQDSRFRQLSTDARTLYGILLDRMSLSAKN